MSKMKGESIFSSAGIDVSELRNDDGTHGGLFIHVMDANSGSYVQLCEDEARDLVSALRASLGGEK